MTLTLIIVLILISGIIGILPHNKWREYTLFSISILAIYFLQPTLPIRNLGFWFSTSTIVITIISWGLVTSKDKRNWQDNWPGLILLVFLILGVGLLRYLDIPSMILPNNPPTIQTIIIFLILYIFLFLLLYRYLGSTKKTLIIASSTILIIFLILKNPFLARWVSNVFRSLSGQSTALASALDIRWFGFSYIAFRILHTFRDRQTGRLPVATFSEYVIYVVFFPSLAAGPIDRIERFLGDYREKIPMSGERYLKAGKRLIIGLFKKFAIADSLALIALNVTNSTQVNTTGWMWFLVYAYSFQIYLDFSGYTDIAIGLGELMGISLPENFNSPYLKPNLTQFWNSWHMTLTHWFRAYFFNPLTRALRSKKNMFSTPAIIFITQLSTMILIGAWHGITWNYLLWGVWHGAGLFIQNRWSDWVKGKFSRFSGSMQRVGKFFGVLLTFNFVAVGWVFFVIKDPSSILKALGLLVGLK